MQVSNVSESAFESRLHAILDEYDDFDESDFSGDGVLGETFGQTLVGHGKQTRETCGHRRMVLACLNVDLHRQKTLDGMIRAGQVYYETINYWCHHPECPVCMPIWAIREACLIEGRLKEASRHFGQVEHLVISVAVRDLGLGMKALRRKAEKILMDLGVLGGCIIPHAFRYRPDHWYLGVHFHILGYVIGGYSECRHCEHRLHRNCPFSCKGFDARCYKEYLKSGWIIKVARDRFGNVGERKSIWATARYELSHATYEKSSKRVHIVSWFGVCSYRRLKWTPEIKKHVCKLCGYELKKSSYVGVGRFDLMPESGWSDFLGSDGKAQWVIIENGGG
jgi:hypothetical protein